MAGNKVNTKSKGKEDKGKVSKSLLLPNDDSEDNDFSLLRRPIQTSITGFLQARKIFDLATEELKSLLSEECDLLYECKVCRNIFRSLANFISHKRVYCKDKFNSSLHGHFVRPCSTDNEISKIRSTEEGYQESLKDPGPKVNMEVDDDDDRIPLTKDLTTIIEKLAKTKGATLNGENVQIALQKIPNSTVAVFQNVGNSGEKKVDSMRNQVHEIDNITSRKIAVLQSDGNFKVSTGENDNVIQISDDEDCDTAELKCKLCDMQFATQKTLKFHMKYKHVESRLVYPCPDCFEIFSTSWSVYRHLFKVHRKTAAQIRRMRESIQAKAFRMNNPPAFYEKRKNLKPVAPQKITEEERIDQENQAWMDNMEGDSETPRCGGCGRTFERRAALAAHTHTCQPRSRALHLVHPHTHTHAHAARRPETKRIEIQIRKDYHKGPTGIQVNRTEANNETKPVKDDNEEPVKQKEVEKPPENDTKNNDETSTESRHSNDANSNETESPEKVNESKPSEPQKTGERIRLPFAQHAEKSNLMALRQKIIADIEFENFVCKKCETPHSTLQELYDHIAAHYKWMRYACKLCNFKHYDFEKLPEHVRLVHKLKGDKDFYFSTVKALDGAEASDLAEPSEETNDKDDETSPESRRPSKCSSDSSRLSDDSSSSSTRIEGTRKRKAQQNKGYAKRKRESILKGQKDEEADEPDAAANVKNFEENSSDMDEIYDRNDKKQVVEDNSSVASRRPVRRKAKPKNEDFEYDLSNLLKMEAQGYRESLGTTTTKTTQTKKNQKPAVEQQNTVSYEILNKESCGALLTLSSRSVLAAKAHMKTLSSTFSTPKEKSNIFIRPMLPKGFSRGEKSSPKKDVIDEKKEIHSNNDSAIKDSPNKSQNENNSKTVDKDPLAVNANNKEENENSSGTKKTQQLNSPASNVPAVVPIKFRRQSLEVIKNPIINKNIKDFTKAGMKTKILVIKPITRNKDGTQSVNSSLNFQTIKLKDGNKNLKGDSKMSDQVLVVKVPKVDCGVNRTVSESGTSTDKSTGVVNEDKSKVNNKPESNKSSVPPKVDETEKLTNGNVENKAEAATNETIIKTESSTETESESKVKNKTDNSATDSALVTNVLATSTTEVKTVS